MKPSAPFPTLQQVIHDKVYVDMPFSGEMTVGLQYTDATRGFIINNRQSIDPSDPNFYKKINNAYPFSFGETFSPYSGRAFNPGPGAESDKEKYYLDFGYTSNVIAHQGVLDQGVHFIQKPFSKKDLTKTVRKILDDVESVETNGSIVP